MNPMQAPNVGVGGKDHGNREITGPIPKKKNGRKKCYVCGKRTIPFGFDLLGRAFCLFKCHDDHCKNKGF